MNVTRDLAALYHANELSSEGRALLEDLAKDDPEVAKLLEKDTMDLERTELYRFSSLDEMKAFEMSKWWRELQFSTLILGLLFTAFFAMHIIQVTGIQLFGIQGRGLVFGGIAIFSWISFFVARYKIRIQ